MCKRAWGMNFNHRLVRANRQNHKNGRKTDRYVPKNERGHLTFMQSTRAMLSAFVCSPETGRKNAEKADKMGISRNTVQ